MRSSWKSLTICFSSPTSGSASATFSLRASSFEATVALRSAGTLSPSSSSCFSVWYTSDSALFLVSTASLRLTSSAAFASASRTICSTSALSSVEDPAIVMVCSFPVPRSFADTLRMPFASMSNVTSIWGTPRGAGGTPSRRKLPKTLLSWANCRSPCSTTISTDGCASTAVEKVSVFFVGIVVLREMSTVDTPPRVSTPSDRGVTSSSTMSFTSPASTPACTAAPIATTSSGFTLWFGSLPMSSLARDWMAGIRVDPPTRTISLMLLGCSFASFRACSTGALQRAMSFWAICSNFALDSVASMCFGPVASAAMNGSDIFASCTPESSTFAFSAASVSRCRACLSFRRSMPSACWKSLASQSTISLSKSSPPRWVSPFVDNTSHTPSPTSRTETSNVPPPRSKTMMVSLFLLSRPYARAAAVGSFTRRSTSRPAIFPASLVACRWESLK
mmetsp:Transcript_56864/g.160480  ORF Transcript_56864/g.160480 Transcript_56864/m.160480 type:complete len:449 (+) Transcript_56864:131-1477(+)